LFILFISADQHIGVYTTSQRLFILFITDCLYYSSVLTDIGVSIAAGRAQPTHARVRLCVLYSGFHTWNQLLSNWTVCVFLQNVHNLRMLLSVCDVRATYLLSYMELIAVCSPLQDVHNLRTLLSAMRLPVLSGGGSGLEADDILAGLAAQGSNAGWVLNVCL